MSSPVKNARAPRPLRRDGYEFLTALMSGYSSDGHEDLRLELRTFVPGDGRADKPGPRRWYPLTLPAVQTAATDALEWSHRADVYMGVLPRLGERGTRNDVPAAAWLWVDVDGGTAGPDASVGLVRASGLPAPNMAVMSGGGTHVYWRLLDPLPLDSPQRRDKLKGVLKRLVMAIGGQAPEAHADTTRADIASILRVPGTWNHKPSRNCRVRLLRLEFESAMSLSWWQAHLPALPCPVHPQRAHEYTPGELPGWALRWAHEPAPEGERHHELIRMATRLRRDLGIDPAVIMGLLAQKADCSPGSRQITDTEIENIARWA